MDEFYDVIDSNGTVIETAEQQYTDAEITEKGKSLIFEQADSNLTKGDKKKLRKLYVTIKHPVVMGCNHKLDITFQPKHRNCDTCWFSWFNSHGELIQQLHEMHTGGLGKAIIQLQGYKFYKKFLSFMSTVAQWKQLQEQNEQTS